MSASPHLAAQRQEASAERKARETKTLRLISRRFNTSKMLVRRTGWHERSVQRYALALERQGLLIRTRDTHLGIQGVWFWRYALTEAGKRAIAGG